jgi:hypothetical protein
MSEAFANAGQITGESVVNISAIIAEAASTFPKSWSSMKCDDLLYQINAEQPIEPESIKGFRNRLIGLLREQNHLCLGAKRWESRAMKLTEARPLQKRLHATMTHFNMEASVHEFGTFAILSVQPLKAERTLDPYLFLGALQTVQAAVKYNVA